MKNEESKIQRGCVAWFAIQYHNLWKAKRLHAVPNGGHRSKATAANMKREGQVSGVWDLHLTLPKGAFAGLWIEVKAGKNGLTDSQIAFREEHEPDYKFAICYSVEEFLIAINDYLNGH